MKRKIVFAMLMGVITTGLISFILISLNVGLAFLHPEIWFKSWIMAYVIVIPSILILSPLVEKITFKIIK